jgi:pyruvate dehydrogenase E2 component (dihydrolipoamide acetyltransferase)
MAFNFYMPDIGEGVVEGEIVAWKVKEGERVVLDQPLVEVMTDKATVELPSPRAGTIIKIHFKDGEICPVGKVLVAIEEDAGAAATAPGPAGGARTGDNGHPERAGHATTAPAFPPGPTLAPPAPVAPLVSGGAIQLVDAAAPRPDVRATPATRRLARELGVEIGRVPPTGPHARVTAEDVRRYQADGGGAAGAEPAPAARPAPQHAPIAVAPGGEEERIPLRGIRKRIAESMARSKHTAAHFTYVEEVDMTELVAVRERAKPRAAERGVKLNYLPFIVKACVSGLKKWPQLNASLDETTQEIVRKKYYHVGIAAQGPHGLAVSVVRDADRRSIFDLSREIDRLGEAVRNNTATRDELTGGTFTISSLGKLGGLHATPIINFPEVAILGVHKIEERPAVRSGQIVIRHLMNLSISVDHRIADGWDGAMFVQDVKALLEDPTTMFMEMI